MDPAIYSELETLRAIKESLEAEKHAYQANLNGLHGQLGQQQEEYQQLQVNFYFNLNLNFESSKKIFNCSKN